MRALLIAVALVGCEDKREPAEKITEPPHATSSAPDGIKGMTFGMSPGKVREALKVGLERIESGSVTGRLPDTERPIPAELRDRALQESTLELGPRRLARTELGGQPATCTLDFLDAGKLTWIRCAIETDDSATLAALMVETLTAKYGPPQGSSFSNKHWSSPTANLEVADYMGEVIVVNKSEINDQRVAERQREADAISARVVREALASQAEDPSSRIREALDKDL